MTEDLDHVVAKIDRMDLEALRANWRDRYGAPPQLRSVLIMRQMLAWRIQAEELGGLDAKSRRTLERSGPVEAEGRHLGLGATLTRNWKGREVTVVIEEGGFRWNDELYPSLSAAASAIAGSRWNGPRFFGLRDG